MKWQLRDIIGAVSLRVGGQLSAALVALGMAQQHESAVAAAVGWAIVSGAEVALSAFSRGKNRRNAGGRN